MNTENMDDEQLAGIYGYYIDYVEECINRNEMPIHFIKWHDTFYHYEKSDND